MEYLVSGRGMCLVFVLYCIVIYFYAFGMKTLMGGTLVLCLLEVFILIFLSEGHKLHLALLLQLLHHRHLQPLRHALQRKQSLLETPSISLKRRHWRQTPLNWTWVSLSRVLWMRYHSTDSRQVLPLQCLWIWVRPGLLSHLETWPHPLPRPSTWKSSWSCCRGSTSCKCRAWEWYLRQRKVCRRCQLVRLGKAAAWHLKRYRLHPVCR